MSIAYAVLAEADQCELAVNKGGNTGILEFSSFYKSKRARALFSIEKRRLQT